MNSTILFQQFNSALNWNAFLYVVHKSTSLIRTFFLYRTISPEDFSTWAVLNSTIFLVLLWADCGLRKSIPRYAHQFYSQHNHFFYGFIIAYSFILLSMVPVLMYLVSYSTQHYLIITLAVGIFITEAINTIIKLIYHAYFFNRSINMLSMIVTTTETAFTLTLIPLLPNTHAILIFLFTTKLIASIVLIITSSILLRSQPRPLVTDQSPPKKYPFIIHSLMMWGTTILKSLSERNFLIPFITYSLGVGEGNIFKVASDGAVWCYRIILKTIGSADTALLSHAEQEGNKLLMAMAVKKLTSKIARLCLPVLGIIGIVSLVPAWFHQYNQFAFQTFLIMAISYILETRLLAYERVLEVKRNYRIIIICYIPYILTLLILILIRRITYIGLLNFLIIIQGVRLVSCILMRCAVYRLYQI